MSTTGRIISPKLETAVPLLIDNTAATPDDVVSDVPASAGASCGSVGCTGNHPTTVSVDAALAAVEANIADLTAKVNALLEALNP